MVDREETKPSDVDRRLSNAVVAPLGAVLVFGIEEWVWRYLGHRSEAGVLLAAIPGAALVTVGVLIGLRLAFGSRGLVLWSIVPAPSEMEESALDRQDRKLAIAQYQRPTSSRPAVP